MARDFYTYRGATELALFHHNLRVTCDTCNHTVVFSGNALWYLCDRKGWPDALSDMARRLYCLPCRKAGRPRRRPRYDVTDDPVTTRALREPTETVWKRLVRRHR